jgi:hypothetical protein
VLEFTKRREMNPAVKPHLISGIANNNKPNSKILPSSPLSPGMVIITTSDYIQIIAAGI